MRAMDGVRRGTRTRRLEEAAAARDSNGNGHGPRPRSRSTTPRSPIARPASRSTAARPAPGSGRFSTEAARSSPTARWARCCSPNGLQFGDPPEVWNLAHPDVIRRIQRGYIEAGSQIVLTNTFGGNRARLRLSGHGDRVDELNRTAAILLRAEVDAAGGHALVAGDIGPSRRDRRAARDARLRRGGRHLPRAGRLAGRRRRRSHLDRDDVRPLRDQGCHRGRPPGFARDRARGHDDVRHARSHDDGGHAGGGRRLPRRDGAPMPSAATVATVRTSSSRSSRRCTRPAPDVVLVAKSNAGMPELVDMRAVYRAEPETMASQVHRDARRGRHDRRRLLREHARATCAPSPPPSRRPPDRGDRRASAQGRGPAPRGRARGALA